MAEAAKKQELAPAEPTVSERFTGMVIKELSSTTGTGVILSEEQKRLAQHLFIKIDAQLNELEKKRTDQNKPPICWQNVNMQKLALDAMHRIELGLDALIPNHIHPIPYLNGRTKKYDLDLRIGYLGKDYYRRTVALDEPTDIRYELVYSTDHFVAKKKTFGSEVESYEFEIKNPFDRGEVIGGFGYISYADPQKNKLILVTKGDFEKSEKKGNKDFWGPHPDNMKLKTVVHRTTDKLTIDPRKVTVSFAAVEEQEAVAEIEAEIVENANQGDIIDVKPETTASQNGAGGMTEEEKAEALAREKAEAEKEKQQRRCPGF
ncbi:MAG: recombinase RecT [Syntrophaceae bacterium]